LNRLFNFILLAASLLILTACARAEAKGLNGQESLEVAQNAQGSSPNAAINNQASIDLTNPCLDCHTDKQQLMENARPEVEEEKESKGVG
jgi:hypothetical protein